MFEIGQYVTHISKGYPPIYRVTRVISAKIVEVEYVGEWVKGKLTNFSNQRNRGYRNISDLSPA